jgi:hypothetical protein
MRRSGAALLIVLGAAPAIAQTQYERVGVDATVGVDTFRGDGVSDRPQVIVDVVGTAQLAEHWQLYVRPWFRQARPATPTGTAPAWDAQIYQASLRYERTGPVATRIDAGYIASPVGLGIFDTNPRTNPTISSHASYFAPMLPFDTNGPRVPAIASTYPLGAVLTLSTDHWDARAAIVNSSPVRISIPGVSTNPRSTPVVEGGAGVTPLTGLRLGLSFARGAYVTSAELSPTAMPGDRLLTMIGFEGEYSVRYTKLTAEVIHDAFEVPGGHAQAYAWFVQATQTLTPRWYVAGRHEGTSSPVAGNSLGLGTQPRMTAGELTVGFRATRDITVKTSYYARQPYGRQDWDQQGGMAIVWQRRWW